MEKAASGRLFLWAVALNGLGDSLTFLRLRKKVGGTPGRPAGGHFFAHQIGAFCACMIPGLGANVPP